MFVNAWYGVPTFRCFAGLGGAHTTGPGRCGGLFGPRRIIAPETRRRRPMRTLSINGSCGAVRITCQGERGV
eukprot:scaffold613858_cov17-Prasinocladus_malaysianus.AAC.1